jgi:sulfur-carrier protein
MPTVVLPGALREFNDGRGDVALPPGPRTLGDALARLWEVCPGARDRVLTERGELRVHVNIFVDGENSRFAAGFDTPVGDASEIIILPAVSGGSV